MDQSDDAETVNALTAIVREADRTFEQVGGSSRHWVRDCFLPMLNREGWHMVKASPQKAGETPLQDGCGFDVELSWSWGTTYRFRETHRFHAQTRAEIDREVREFIEKMADRYAYDCSRLTQPLHPCLTGLRITPSQPRVYETTERFSADVDAAVARVTAKLQAAESSRVASPTQEPA